MEDRYSRSRINSFSIAPGEEDDHLSSIHKYGASPKSPMFAYVAPLQDTASVHSRTPSGRNLLRTASVDESVDTDNIIEGSEVEKSSANAPKSRCRSIVGTLSSMAPEIIHLFAYPSTDTTGEITYTYIA